MDLCPKGELFNVLKELDHFAVEDAKKLIKQLFSGLKFIHDKQIIHRDLKPQNIFMVSKRHAKIGDFGLSEYAPDGFVVGARLDDFKKMRKL